MNAVNQRRQEISVDATKCQTCLICMMRCGLRFDKASNPYAGKIHVDPYYGLWPEIRFDESCDRCGICVRYCPGGALSLVEQAAQKEPK